jgi:hypothetical protein
MGNNRSGGISVIISRARTRGSVVASLFIAERRAVGGVKRCVAAFLVRGGPRRRGIRVRRLG